MTYHLCRTNALQRTAGSGFSVIQALRRRSLSLGVSRHDRVETLHHVQSFSHDGDFLLESLGFQALEFVPITIEQYRWKVFEDTRPDVEFLESPREIG